MGLTRGWLLPAWGGVFCLNNQSPCPVRAGDRRLFAAIRNIWPSKGTSSACRYKGLFFLI